jgi:putative Mn2+ efflux pump MntP
MALIMVLVALGLAMDSFSVSVTNGLASQRFEARSALTIGAFFGMFQALMPLVGWLAGVHFIGLISGFDHWIAFLLLAVIGCRLILDALRSGSKSSVGSLGIGALLMLSVATSIDALAVGLTLPVLQLPIAATVVVVGVVTFSLSVLGVYLGGKIGRLVSHRVGILGGLILIALGMKILVDHVGTA